MTTESKVDPPVDPRASVRLLEEVVEPVVNTMGFTLCHLEWAGGSGKRILRVFLDHERGVTLDDCAKLNRILSSALDAAEAVPEAVELARVLGGPYILEVSSPGIERPLSRRSQFDRFVGQRVTVRTYVPLVEGSKQRTFHGQIAATEPDPARPDDDRDGFVIVDGDGGDEHRISLAQIRRANLVYEG